MVVYGFDSLTGIFIRIKDLVKKLFAKKPEKPAAAKPAAEAVAGAAKPETAPEDKPVSELTEEEMKKVLRAKKEAQYRKDGLKPCANPDCNKDDNGFNQWVAKDRQFCSGSCRTIIQNKNRKEKK